MGSMLLHCFLVKPLICKLFFFKVTMLHQSKEILRKENEFNHLIKIWRKIFASAIFNHKISEFVELVEIATLQVLGFIEDECTFNTINFMKNKLLNQFNPDLDLCTKFYNQHFFTMQNFPYEYSMANGLANHAIVLICVGGK